MSSNSEEWSVTRLTKSEHVSAVTLNWWFWDGPLLTREGVIELGRYFAGQFPQFAPRRYGDSEPPKFRFDLSSIDHFADTALTTQPIFVWYASNLCEVSFRPNYGPTWRVLAGGQGYCIPYLKLSCPLDFLGDQDVNRSLRNCWDFVTKLAQPIYGDIRILDGYMRRGNRLVTIAGDPPDRHPVLGPWRGLPRTLGLAIALGEPYLSLWPSMRTHSHGTVAMATLSDWTAPGCVADLVGEPPEALCQPGDPVVNRESYTTADGAVVRRGNLIRPTGLAALWPFPAPPSE